MKCFYSEADISFIVTFNIRLSTHSNIGTLLETPDDILTKSLDNVNIL